MAPGMTAAAAIWLGLLFCNPAVALVPRSSNGWTAKSSHIQQSSQHAAASSATASAAQPAYPAIHASSGPAQQSHQQQRRLSAVLRSAAAIAASAGAAKLPQIQIPQPPPGADIPVEPLVPLYSPDQLRLRLPPIAGALPDGQIISLMEQMQQAEALHTTLSSEQLQYANPLLGRQGVLKLPEKTLPEHYPEGYVAICAIVKNQHKDLREWIEYHKWIGVSKIYIYDNNSTEPLTRVIQDFMHSGYVEYSFFIGQPRYRDLFRTSSQWWAYHDCVTRYRNRHRWLAFIDADEFIVFHDGTTNINAFMQRYIQYGGLALNWLVFGSSGHKQRPEGGVLVNYKQCLPDQQEQNQHVKVIANTAHLMTVGDDPHRVYYNDKKYYTVNELGDKVTGPKSPPSHTKIALYHYLTKSEGEYMAKVARGSAAGNYKAPEFFYAINGLATDTCSRAVPLGLKCCPAVRAELGPEGVRRVEKEMQQVQQQTAAVRP